MARSKSNSKTKSAGAKAPAMASTPQDEAPVAFYEDGGEVEKNRKFRLALFAYRGTDDNLLQDIWGTHCVAEAFTLSYTDDDFNIRQELERLVANSLIDDGFVVVPPNTIPCSQITFEEMMMPVVYEDMQKRQHYNHRLPMYFVKAHLVDLLATSDAEGEDFVREYVQKYCSRPIQVSYAFGNFVMPVLRANPCEHKVIEGLLRRKYITTTREGFIAIEKILEEKLL